MTTVTQALSESGARALRDAWSRYLERTKTMTGYEYEDVEPWAWEQLKDTLRVHKLTPRGKRAR